jgi:serine/threonine-protein kinase HipA
MKLDVSANGIGIGCLSLNTQTGLYAFDYFTNWLDREDCFPLSPALPLIRNTTSDEQHSADVRQFFQNLLPEGQTLDDAAQANKVSKSNLVGLLAALGQETAGALQISIPDSPSTPLALDGKRLLTRQELSQRIRSRPDEAFSVWDGKVRLSIAGYQDKIAVLDEAGQWYLVDGGNLASTYLLKPDPLRSGLQHMTSNELACMTLAQSVGIPAAEVRLEQIPEPVIFIRRFDRQVESDRIVRLHCIDGCQALGLGVSMKYERPYGDGRDVQHIRDGVSLPKLFSLVDQYSVQPVADRLALLRWTVFQILIGNTDAHGKNLSFFIDAGGIRLAPAYDLVCCLMYAGDRISDTLSMAIGDNFDIRSLTAYDWAQMAAECGLNPRLVSRELKQLAGKILKIWPTLKAQLTAKGADKDTLVAVEAIIKQQCQRAQIIATDIPKIAKDVL